MDELGAAIVHVYGLTEIYGPNTVCPMEEEWRALPAEERAGFKARQGVATSLARAVGSSTRTMRDVPRDGETIGEVVMRGNNVMGLLRRPGGDRRRAFRGGWFHSGDLAVLHPDGNVDLRDRGKDIIISGGENISTIEVEQAHRRATRRCSSAPSIARPDTSMGRASRRRSSTLKEGAAATAEELVAFARERLAHFKCPEAVEFGPLPKTSTGKVQKYVLREQEWAGHETRIGAT